MVPGWVIGAAPDVQRKDGKKHHVHSVLNLFFYSLKFRDASTSLVISRLGSLGVYQKAVNFYCYIINASFVEFTDFNFMIYYMNLTNKGHMDLGNENPT